MISRDRNFDEARVHAGETIAREGSLCHQFVVVLAGQLSVDRGGQEVILGPGDSYGWEAMEERGLNDATVVARTEARLLVMSHSQFRAAAAQQAPARKAGIRERTSTVNSLEEQAS
jgi:CRP-like cAMP-binding protein